MLSELLSPQRILLDLQSCRKRDVINLLAEQFARDLGGSAETYAGPLLKREQLGSSAIGMGIALPHGNASEVAEPVAAVAVFRTPCSFPTPDSVNVDIAIAVLTHAASPDDLSILASIVKELRQEPIRQAIRCAESPEQLIGALRDIERSN